MLNERNIAFHYREYTKEPLTEVEIRSVLAKLEVPVKTLIRRADKAYKELALTGNEPEEVLVAHIASHPTLLRRPIGVMGDRAVVGRPVENLLGLVG